MKKLKSFLIYSSSFIAVAAMALTIYQFESVIDNQKSYLEAASAQQRIKTCHDRVTRTAKAFVNKYTKLNKVSAEYMDQTESCFREEYNKLVESQAFLSLKKPFDTYLNHLQFFHHSVLRKVLKARYGRTYSKKIVGVEKEKFNIFHEAFSTKLNQLSKNASPVGNIHILFGFLSFILFSLIAGYNRLSLTRRSQSGFKKVEKWSLEALRKEGLTQDQHIIAYEKALTGAFNELQLKNTLNVLAQYKRLLEQKQNVTMKMEQVNSLVEEKEQIRINIENIMNRVSSVELKRELKKKPVPVIAKFEEIEDSYERDIDSVIHDAIEECSKALFGIEVNIDVESDCFFPIDSNRMKAYLKSMIRTMVAQTSELIGQKQMSISTLMRNGEISMEFRMQLKGREEDLFAKRSTKHFHPNVEFENLTANKIHFDKYRYFSDVNDVTGKKIGTVCFLTFDFVLDIDDRSHLSL